MKKKKRNPVILFLCLVLVIFIVAGPYYLLYFKPRTVDYNLVRQKPEWTGVISFWDYPHLDQKTGTNYGWIREKIKAFEKKHPGVYIDFKPISMDRGPIQLDTAIKMGTHPDIAPVGSVYSMMNKDILEPLDLYLTVEEMRGFNDQALRAVTYNGHVWAMPWMMSTYTMVINLDLFHERGIEPPVDGNWTYEEFVEKMQALTYDSKGKGKIDHFGFHSFVQSGYYNLWGIILSDGAQIFDEQLRYRFNTPEALSGIQKVIELKHQYGVTPPDFGENSSNAAWTMFHKEQNVGVYPTGTWALNVLEQLRNEGKGFDYTVVNYPVGKTGSPTPVSNMVGSYGIFKQEDEKKLQMCLEFLRFLAKDEYQEQLNRLGVFPVKKSIGNVYVGDPMMTQIYDNLQNTTIIPAHPYWKEIDEIMQNEIRQGVLGKKGAKEVLRDMEEKVNVLLRTLSQ